MNTWASWLTTKFELRWVQGGVSFPAFAAGAATDVITGPDWLRIMCILLVSYPSYLYLSQLVCLYHLLGMSYVLSLRLQAVRGRGFPPYTHTTPYISEAWHDWSLGTPAIWIVNPVVPYVPHWEQFLLLSQKSHQTSLHSASLPLFPYALPAVVGVWQVSKHLASSK